MRLRVGSAKLTDCGVQPELRCRAHNQYEAERAFGAGFMSEKREHARRVAAERRARSTQAEKCAWVSAQELTRDVLAGLDGLGIRGEEAQTGGHRRRQPRAARHDQ